MHGYYAMISEVDHWVGQVLTALEEAGHAEGTIVAFTSDHGEFLGDFGMWGKSFPGPDCVSRVPLIVSAPGGTSGVCDALVEAVDLVPTFFDLCGVTPPPDLDGRSLRPALFDAEGSRGREEVLMEGSLRLPAWRSIRTRTHRYLLDAEGREWLYDLEQPLGEHRDVAAEADPALLAGLRHRLATRMISSFRGKTRVWPY